MDREFDEKKRAFSEHRLRRYDEKLAEIVGIMQGDGCLHRDNRGALNTIVCFHPEEKKYQQHVFKLFSEYFDIVFGWQEISQEKLMRTGSSKVGNALLRAGLKPGRKTMNGTNIPKWIFQERTLMIAYLRGVFDSDGCVYRKYDDYAQVQIKLATKALVMSLRKLLITLGFHPTKMQKEIRGGFPCWKIYLSRQGEIDIFFDLVRPANTKHVKRLKEIRGVT